MFSFQIENEDTDGLGLWMYAAVEVFWGEQRRKMPIYRLQNLKSLEEVMQVLMHEHEINWQNIGEEVVFLVGEKRYSLEDNF